jgi:hypothetical protein
MVSKDDLLARAKAGRVKTVEVDGVALYVRRFGLSERVEIGTRARGGDPPAPHEYLALGLCNEDGSPLFTVDEAKAFSDDDGQFAEKVVNLVLEHAGLTQSAQDAALKN